MKRLLLAVAAAGLLLLPSIALAENQAAEINPSPVSQEIVREGDFALDLVVVLKLGEPASEAEAEDMLTAAGITPENGWIADYPVTPDVLADIEDTVGKAADTGKLSIGKEEAVKAVYDLAMEYGLAVRPAGEYAEAGEYTAERVGAAEDYYEPEVIREYYYTEGPPVITYYTPPWDYYYLYAWVPYPFWWYGYWYPGYFILNDFSVVVHHHHHHKFHKRWHKDWDTARVASNHVRDRKGDGVSRIDPLSRKAARVEARKSRADRRAVRDSTRVDRSSAESILSRETSRAERRALRNEARDARRTERAARQDGSSVSGDRSATRLERRALRNEARGTRQMERATRLGDSGRVRSGRPDAGSERPTRLGDRSVGRSEHRSADRSISRGLGGGGRSFGAPSRGGGDRSFARPSGGGGGGGRSFSAPSRGFGGGGHRGGRGGGGGGCRGRNC